MNCKQERSQNILQHNIQKLIVGNITRFIIIDNTV